VDPKAAPIPSSWYIRVAWLIPSGVTGGLYQNIKISQTHWNMIIPAYCGEKPKRKLSHEIVEEHTNGIFGAA
jgi:hypothetical protein